MVPTSAQLSEDTLGLKSAKSLQVQWPAVPPLTPATFSNLSGIYFKFLIKNLEQKKTQTARSEDGSSS